MEFPNPTFGKPEIEIVANGNKLSDEDSAKIKKVFIIRSIFKAKLGH